MLASASAPVRLIDAGAGRGRFVATARAAGVQTDGIEPSRRGVLAAATRYGVDLQPTTVEEAQVPAGSVDAVTLWHVLEHADDPAAMLDGVRGWLRPGGGLLVGVPNLASLQARLSRGCWFHLDVPRHRVHFTPRGLHALLARRGFQPLAIEHRLVEQNWFGMWQSLTSLLTEMPSYAYHLLKRNAPLRSADLAATLLALPLAPLAVALEVIAARAGRGGTIAVLAQRVEN